VSLEGHGHADVIRGLVNYTHSYISGVWHVSGDLNAGRGAW